MRHLHDVVLLWLATRPEHEGVASDLRKALAPLWGARRSASDRDAAIARALGDAEAAAEVERDRRGRLRLTDGGAARVAATFGIAGGARPSWRAIKETLLPRHALGLSGDGKASADQLRAVVLARAHDLDGRAATSLMHVVALLAAQAVGAPRADARALQTAIVSRWLDESPPPPSATSHAHGNGKAWPDDPEHLAERILTAARTMRSGRFGDDKVFVSHLFRVLSPPHASLEQFKSELLELHRHQRLTLSRADLVEAMDPRDVAESEIRHQNATFHFVRLT
jgi:hypothetical protein